MMINDDDNHEYDDDDDVMVVVVVEIYTFSIEGGTKGSPIVSVKFYFF